MKYFLTLLITLKSIQLFAGTYYPAGKPDSKTFYLKLSDCVKAEGDQYPCLDTEGKDIRYHEVQTVSVDDPSKPIFKAPYNTGNCTTNDIGGDCSDALMAASEESPCEEGDSYQIKRNELAPGYTYYCSSIIGYEQVEQKQLVENAGLKTSVLAEDAAKKAQADAEVAVMKAMAFGKSLKAKIAVINLQRGLTEAQVKQFVDEFETINRLLDAGAIQTAKSNIAGLSPDEVLLRAEDRDKIIAEIDSYLGL